MGARTEYSRAYYLANQERIKAYNREYARQHKERKRELTDKWAKEHPLRISDIQRRSYIKHLDARREAARAYYWRKKGETESV